SRLRSTSSGRASAACTVRAGSIEDARRSAASAKLSIPAWAAVIAIASSTSAYQAAMPAMARCRSASASARASSLSASRSSSRADERRALITSASISLTTRSSAGSIVSTGATPSAHSRRPSADGASEPSTITTAGPCACTRAANAPRTSATETSASLMRSSAIAAVAEVDRPSARAVARLDLPADAAEQERYPHGHTDQADQCGGARRVEQQPDRERHRQGHDRVGDEQHAHQPLPFGSRLHRRLASCGLLLSLQILLVLLLRLLAHDAHPSITRSIRNVTSASVRLRRLSRLHHSSR